MHKSSRYFIVGALVLGVLILSAVALKYKSRVPQNKEEAASKSVEAVYGLGTVTAENAFHLKSGITTQIKKIFVKEGDLVRSGDPLVSLDDSGIQSAPFDGTITALPYKIKENVFPQTIIVSLIDLKHLYILVALEQQAALFVKRGQIARLSFDNLRDHLLTGVVRAIYPSDGQFLVRIDVAQFPSGILPGMTADVAIVYK